jgi:hypothetical protein
MMNKDRCIASSLEASQDLPVLANPQPDATPYFGK